MIMKNIICDGVILNIIRSHKFRWSEKGLGCEYLTGWASAELITLFHATGLFLYPFKRPENFWFFNVFKGHRMRPVAWNVLSHKVKCYILQLWLRRQLLCI